MNWYFIQSVRQAQRLDIAERADRCVKWLKIQGFEVLRVEQGPRIIIRTCPLCDKFEGAIETYERNLQAAHRYKKVMRLDCEVRWEIGGAA